MEDGDIKIKSRNLSLYNLARMCGILQVFAGTYCMDKQGMELDEVKDMLLDIHLAAVETVEKAVTHRGRRG